METLIMNTETLNFCESYKIELFINPKGKPVARLLKTNTVGKNKGMDKLIKGYYFNSESQRDIWVKEQITNITANIESDKKRKEQKKDAICGHPFKEGDIVYQSWGYDQTNIDFYQITQVLPKFVKIRPISQISVNSAGFMCEYVKPNVNAFIGEETTRPIKANIWGNETHFSISNGRHSLTLYNGGEKGIYQSHYA